MANIAIFRINYKSDFILTLNSDAGWMTPFCIKFWTGAPSQAYFAGFDGTTYTHCAPVDGELTKLCVQFDDHHLPIGDLKFQVAYHFTIADFPTTVEDEVLNQASVIIEVDDAPAQVMLDLNGETAPEIEFSLPAYANEAQRIANEQQRITNEEARIAVETVRQQNEEQRIQQETARVNEFARLKRESEAATDDAYAAAMLANAKAQLAADKAAFADAAATLAKAKAQQAADKAALADAAATLANDKADLAQQKAEYAQTQGDYAKAQGDYAKAQGDTAQADHERAESDHTTAAADHTTADADHTTAAADHTTATSDHSRAEADHTTAASDHTRAEADHTTASSDHSRAESDHTTAASDHTRAESDHTIAAADHTTSQADHTRAESDHAAVEVYVDSLGVFDLSKHNAVGGVLATYADLDAALNALNALDSQYKYGGMSFKFVQSSDNKYVQYRLTANQWSINTDDWQDENCVSTQESARYILAILDGNDNVVIGITKEGKLVCDDSLLQDVGVIKAKVNISDIVDNLTTESIVVPLSANQGVRIKELIDGLNERIVSLEQSYTFITNDIYLFAIVDADEKVLWGIKRDGKLDEPTRQEDSLNWLFALTDGDDKVCFGIRKDNSIYAPGLTMPNYDAEIAELHEDISENTEAIADVQEDLEKFKNSEDTIEVAIGKQKSYGTYQSELEASPIINSSDNYNVGYKVIGKDKMKHDIAKSFVVFNHDDGFVGDLTATRRIYNKYGFKASICAIFQPFASLQDAKVRIENFKKWLNDGHEIGLHAIMNSSYWYYNRVNDVRPDGTTSFAPLISEMRGSNVDGTGVNTFGTTITADTTIRNAGISGSGVYASEYLDTKVVEATQVQLDDVLRGYCFYGDRLVQNGIESLEINIDTATSASVVGKTRIQWLEYFYNRLIDNTIGYSSTSTDIATRFAEDYDFPEGATAADYYPDITHMLNGKMVYYGDTTNPHYNDSNYQKVGRFKKGIFKGCFTCCNYEILDRVVEVAQAFFRHYYGLNHFTDMHRHGGGYYSLLYLDDGIYYMNREKTILYDNHGKFYVSHRGTWLRGIDIFNEQDIEMLKDTSHRNNLCLEGEAGFYYGQRGIRTNHGLGGYSSGYGNYINYLAMFGSGDTGMEDMSVSTFNTYMEGVNNWLKFCYENAGQNVTQNGLTMKVYSYIKGIVQQVAGSIGTGKITQISVDTIKNNPAIFAAVDILLRFFKDNRIECLSYEAGMDKILSMDRDISGNLFPNAGFNQTVLEYFGGSSNSNKAYIPDGWNDNNANNTETFSVGNETVNGIDTRVLTISGKTDIMANILGLPQGNYKLSYDIKSSVSGSTNFRSYKIGNKKGTYTTLNDYSHTSEWVTKEIEFSIDAPHRNMVDESNPVSIISDGYEDNVFRLRFGLYSGNADNVMKLANVKLYKI